MKTLYSNQTRRIRGGVGDPNLSISPGVRPCVPIRSAEGKPAPAAGPGEGASISGQTGSWGWVVRTGHGGIKIKD